MNVQYLQTQLMNLSKYIIFYNMVFVGQTILLCTLVRNCDKVIYQTFIISHTKFEQIWIIKVV